MSTQNSKIRVRFAPSPTGEPHIGNIRSALFNWLFARHHNGEFILRIEDTDRNRIVEGSLEKILESLKWLGLDYDEGPYFQSERLDIYKKYAEQLLKEGKAYYCFCTPERLKKMRQAQTAKKQAPRYDRLCLSLSEKEIKRNIAAKIPYTIRLKIPEGKTKFKDLIHGEIIFQNKEIDDQILLKSDGYPTYHLANVIDDHLMKISHVIRGEEWLSSTPKHIILYQALNWNPPEFAHLPIILGPDKSKLSKRHGAASVLEYRRLGYLPKALINFMVLLGWNPKTEREIFSPEELIEQFSLDKIQKSGAVFNIQKLDWINGQYIRKLDLDNLTNFCIPYLEKAGLIERSQKPKTKSQKYNSKFKIIKTDEIISFDWLKSVVALEQERMKKLSEVGELTEFFFVDKLYYEPELLVWKKTSFSETKENLDEIEKTLYNVKNADFAENGLKNALKDLINKKGRGEILWPLRAALSGRRASPGPYEIAQVLGKEKVLKRIREAKKKIKLP